MDPRTDRAEGDDNPGPRRRFGVGWRGFSTPQGDPQVAVRDHHTGTDMGVFNGLDAHEQARACADAHEDRVRAACERYGPAPEIGRVWLHRPTGTAGMTGVLMHIDGGPIAGGWSRRLLAPVTPVPPPKGHRWPGRTPAEVEEVLRATGWRVVSRAEAADALRAGGYLLGANRDAGHLLYDDQGDDRTWTLHDTGVSNEVFVACEPGSL